MARTNSSSSLNAMWFTAIMAVGLVSILGVAMTAPTKQTMPVLTSEPTVAAPLPPGKRNTFDFGNQKLKVEQDELSFVNDKFEGTGATSRHYAVVVNQTTNSLQNRGAAIVADTTGASGAFHYVVGGMLEGDKKTFSPAVFLGDRIKIQSVTVTNPGEHDNGLITVDYLDHAPNEPMVAAPTVHKTVKLTFLDNGTLMPVLH